MISFRLNAPRDAGFVDVPTPVPGPQEVLLSVRYVGYCGSDLNTFRGLNPMVSYPRIPGHEISGVIVECGSQVPADWGVGTAVTLSPYTNCGVCSACRQMRSNCCRANQTLGVQRDGALTEFVTVPWTKLFRSASLSLKDLCLVEPLTVGGHATARGRVAAGETVCVLGCGAIGLGAIAAAASRQAHVIAVDIDAAKLDLARAAGAAQVINSAADDLGTAVSALTAGEGPHVVIEAIGLPVTFRAAVEMACFAGRVVYIGYAKCPVEYETKLFVQKELDVLGSRNALGSDFEAVIAMLESGVFPVDRVITRCYAFAEAGQALRDWDADPSAVTKILIQVSSGS